MDRLGDLVCTLPVDQHPHLTQPNQTIHWLVAQGLEPVVESATPSRLFWSLPLKFSIQSLMALIQKLKIESYDQVILFYAPWWVALACWWVGIPHRHSPRSRWYQLLFFNRTLKQKRSRSEKHEADYNWDLLHWSLTGIHPAPTVTPILSLKSSAPLPETLPENYIVVHPGMGGSALNWPTHFYLDLIKKLHAQGQKIVITGTTIDQPWLSPLEKPLSSLEGVFWMVGKLDLKSLIAVLAQSSATIAPSTGVLHLAASTGTKTIGIYSPIRVQTPVRWGPRGSKAQAITPSPSILCPATTHCLEKACRHYPCLETITPDQILAEIFKKTSL